MTAKCEICSREFKNLKGLRVHKSSGHDKPWMDEDKLRSEYLEAGRSSYDLADEWGCDSKTVRNWLDEYDIDKRTAKDYHRVEYVSYETTEQGYGRWQHHYGKDRGRSVVVHRLAAVAWYGLDAIKGKHVHHKNGVKWDNREENLSFMTPGSHMKHHQESGEIPVGPEAQRRGGYDPKGKYVGYANEERWEGMCEELTGDETE